MKLVLNRPNYFRSGAHDVLLQVGQGPELCRTIYKALKAANVAVSGYKAYNTGYSTVGLVMPAEALTTSKPYTLSNQGVEWLESLEAIVDTLELEGFQAF